MNKTPFNKDLCFNIKLLGIDLIHSTRLLCTHFKIDRLKALCMFYIFQGANE